MAAISRQLRDALIRIRNDPALQPFVAHLRNEIAGEVKAMAALDAPMVYRAQGAYGTLERLKNLIDTADRLVVTDDPSNTAGPM